MRNKITKTTVDGRSMFVLAPSGVSQDTKELCGKGFAFGGRKASILLDVLREHGPDTLIGALAAYLGESVPVSATPAPPVQATATPAPVATASVATPTHPANTKRIIGDGVPRPKASSFDVAPPVESGWEYGTIRESARRLNHYRRKLSDPGWMDRFVPATSDHRKYWRPVSGNLDVSKIAWASGPAVKLDDPTPAVPVQVQAAPAAEPTPAPTVDLQAIIAAVIAALPAGVKVG